MPDLRRTRQRVKIVLASLAVIDVVAVAIYLSPLVGSELSRQEQMKQLWSELQQKTRQVEPLKGLPQKIPVARQEIDQFYKDRLPAQDSQISDEIGKLANQSGIRIGDIKYKMADPDKAADLERMGVDRVSIEADLAGDYLQLVRFINALERDKVFFLLDSVVLGGEQGGVVRLQLKMETYLRTGVAL
jgi:type IV pilus assembly protein PilO